MHIHTYIHTFMHAQVRLVRTDVVGGGTEEAMRMNIVGEEQLLDPSERLPDTRPTVT